MTANSIKNLMQTDNSALQRIFAKAAQLKELNDILMQFIDPKLKRSCLVANLHEDKLIVLAQNASVATHFRFSIPELLPQLQKHPLLKGINKIECKVSL